MTTKKISDSTVRRLSRYLRQLREFERHDSRIVSSTELASGSGTTAAQVRKDLSHFGSFGKRGQGYSVPDLRQRLEDILGLSRRWPVAVIGVGKIGSALLGYGRFANKGFDIIERFVVDAAHANRPLINRFPNFFGTFAFYRLGRPSHAA